MEGSGVDQEPEGLFEINEISGKIWNVKPVDRETHQYFIVKIWAVSPGGELLENPVSLKILVLDRNDHKPVFTQPVFYAPVLELSNIVTPVMRVSATDADEPNTLNSDLVYSISGEETIPPNVLDKKIFAISSIGGVIYAHAAVPAIEEVKAFIVKLRVGDMGGPGLTDDALAIIKVIDINNHVPEFIPTSYHMSAVEKTLGDIGRVSVTDGDEPGTRNWVAKYSISDDPHGHFNIRTDAETNQGILSVVKPLDFETVKKLNLTLRVENIHPLSNKAPKAPVSTATVVVTVFEENQPPYITENPIRISVPENVLPGTSLKRDIAVHPHVNVTMSFEITEDPEDWLDINKDTGEISTKRSINMGSPHVQEKVYTAAVVVTAAGGLSSTAAVQITLVETNDFAPRLSPLSGSICKTGGRFCSGLVLTAVDEDLPPHADPFSFEISVETSTTKWTLTKVNGTVAVLQPGVGLQLGVYLVTVMVSDSGTPPLYSTAQVNVTLRECDSSDDCLDSGLGAGLISLITVVMVTPVLILCIASTLKDLYKLSAHWVKGKCLLQMLRRTTIPQISFRTRNYEP
ncbi:cadherin-15-like [Neosynchiropus ocellatus]